MAIQFSSDRRRAWRILSDGREFAISIAEALKLIARGVPEAK